MSHVVEVPEEAIREAVRMLFELANLKAEPTGALAIGEDLKRGVRSVKEVIIIDEEEVTEEILQNKVKKLINQIEKLHKHYQKGEQLTEKLAEMTQKKNPRAYRKCRWHLGRELVQVSLAIRAIKFTNPERKRLMDRVNKTVDTMRSLDRQVQSYEKKIDATRSEDLKKEYRKNQRNCRGGHAHTIVDCLGSREYCWKPVAAQNGLPHAGAYRYDTPNYWLILDVTHQRRHLASESDCRSVADGRRHGLVHSCVSHCGSKHC